MLGFMNGVKTVSVRNLRLRVAGESSVSHAVHIALVPGVARLHPDGRGHVVEQGLLNRRGQYCPDRNCQSTPFDLLRLVNYYVMDLEHKKTQQRWLTWLGLCL